ESVVSLDSGIAVTKRYLRQIWQTKCTKSNETSSLLPAGLPGTARLLPQDLLSRVSHLEAALLTFKILSCTFVSYCEYN
ncbi:unnamed protein product, partial [Porites lobata]